ncbi:hypothetical protein, partial [Anaerostipes hadrus]|uniref:hypothetical protein n=1 Tax=Anaerostipes hadrus TaxID=649756 RepID=UPI001EDD8307
LTFSSYPVYTSLSIALSFSLKKCCRCFMGWENTIQALIEEARGRLLDMLLQGRELKDCGRIVE